MTIASVDLDYTPLVCAMIKCAYAEARRKGPYGTAWQWLVGQEAQDYCEMLGIPHNKIRYQMAELAAGRHYQKPRPVLFLEAFILKVGGVYG